MKWRSRTNTAISRRTKRTARVTLRTIGFPRTTEDLLNRSRLIEAATAEGDTLVVLIKEIGTDALFALLAVTAEFEDQTYFERVKSFYEHCRGNDLSLAVAQTDVKGDRVKRPSQQSDPDMYLRRRRATAGWRPWSGERKRTHPW